LKSVLGSNPFTEDTLMVIPTEVSPPARVFKVEIGAAAEMTLTVVSGT